MTASESARTHARQAGQEPAPIAEQGVDAETEPARSSADVHSSSALLDARFRPELSPWRITAAWSLAASVLAAGIGDVSRTVSPLLLVAVYLLVDPLWGNIWGGLIAPDTLPRSRQTTRLGPTRLPYLASGSPAARLLGLHGQSNLAVLIRGWAPGAAAAFVVALAIGEAAVWATLAVLGMAVFAWLHRQFGLIPVSVLHSLTVVAAPWSLGLALFGVDPWNATHWALILLWCVHLWAGNLCLERPESRGGQVGLALAQGGIAFLLIVGRAPLPLMILGVLWLATWLSVYRGQSFFAIQATWTAALLVSASAMAQIGQ